MAGRIKSEGIMSEEHPILFSAEEMVKAILDGRKTQTRRLRGLNAINDKPEIWNYLEQIENEYHFGHGDPNGDAWGEGFVKCPYGKVGDRLWVRESFQVHANSYLLGMACGNYADGKRFKIVLNDRENRLLNNRKYPNRKTSGRFMYKSLARIWLEITGIRVERVQEISELDAMAEGCQPEIIRCRDLAGLVYGGNQWGDIPSYKTGFKKLWDSLNAKRGLCKTCKGSQKVVGWTGSLEANSLMQTAEDCPDCNGPTGYGWDKNPWVWVISFKRIKAVSEDEG